MSLKKKVERYTIIRAITAGDLVREVNAHLREGWSCVGGAQHVQTKIGGNQYDYKLINSWLQTMVTRRRA